MKHEDAGRSLLEALATIPDPRSRHGRRHPLGAVLALSVAAMLSGARSLYAIWQWGRLQDPTVIQALGFTRQQTPSVSTLHAVFRQLDVEAFETALQGWAQRQADGQHLVIALDGKALRGIHGEQLPGVRLVAGYADEPGLVLGQVGGQEQPA